MKQKGSMTDVHSPLGIDGRISLLTNDEHMVLTINFAADDIQAVLLPAIRRGYIQRNLKEISRSLFRAAYFQAEADMGRYMQEWLRDTLVAGAERQQNDNGGKTI